MSTPEQSNAVHQNDDLDQGPLAHHHTLGFSPSQAAPGNYAYKLVVQDEGTAVATNPTVLNFAGASVAVTTVGSVVTVTVSGSGSSGATWYSGAGTPSSGTGANGDFYLNTNNGDVYQKVSGTWTYIGSVKASEQLHVYVKNNAGVAITKGQAVYVSGADGTNVLVKLAQANAESTSSQTLGLAESNIAINGFGYIAVFGLLSNIDTSAGAAGDPVWLSGTTAGGLLFGLANKPVAPTHLVYIGTVTKANVSTGEIFIREQNGYELDELHDVSITSKTNGDLIQYESSSGLWKNKAQSTLTIAESQVTNLVTDLAGKSPTSHTHTQFIPAGGTAGQVLSKIDATNYNTQWTTPSAGGGGGSSNPLIDTWVYRNVTTVADPGNGYFTLNSLTPGSVSKLMCNYQTSGGVNQTELLEKVKTGDSVFFTPSPTLTGSKWWRAEISAKTRNYTSSISQRTSIAQSFVDNTPNPTASTVLASTAFNAGDLIIVNVAMYSDIVPTINTPTCTGLTFTLVGTQTQPTTTTRVSTYYAYTSTALSARSITVSGSGGTGYIGIIGEAAVITGVDPVNPIGSYNTGSITSGARTATGTSLNTADGNNSLVYGYFWETTGSSATLTSTDLTLNPTINVGVRTGYKSVASRNTPTTTSMTSNWVSGPWSWLYTQVEIRSDQSSYWTFDVVKPTVGYSLPSNLDSCSLMFVPNSNVQISSDGTTVSLVNQPYIKFRGAESTVSSNTNIVQVQRIILDDYVSAEKSTAGGVGEYPSTTVGNPGDILLFRGGTSFPKLMFKSVARYGLSSLSVTAGSNVGTYTTQFRHNLSVGDYIDLNAGIPSLVGGVSPIYKLLRVETVPSSTTFTVLYPANVITTQTSALSSSGQWALNRFKLQTVPVVTRSSSGTTRTITTAYPHNIYSGTTMYVNLINFSDSRYNESNVGVTRINSTQFSYTGTTGSFSEASTSETAGFLEIGFWPDGNTVISNTAEQTAGGTTEPNTVGAIRLPVYPAPVLTSSGIAVAGAMATTPSSTPTDAGWNSISGTWVYTAGDPSYSASTTADTSARVFSSGTGASGEGVGQSIILRVFALPTEASTGFMYTGWGSGTFGLIARINSVGRLELYYPFTGKSMAATANGTVVAGDLVIVERIGRRVTTSVWTYNEATGHTKKAAGSLETVAHRIGDYGSSGQSYGFASFGFIGSTTAKWYAAQNTAAGALINERFGRFHV